MQSGTPERAARLQNQLPHMDAQTAFIGRQPELDDLLRQVAQRRWLTLIGVGGSGKTTLARQLAYRAEQLFERGVCWVSLDAVNDPAQVSHAVAAALAIDAIPAMTLEDAIVEHLGSQQILLVLDNCEHVLTAVRALCDSIHQRCPRSTLLTTSRIALDSPCETRWDVPLLSAEDASALFIHRARGLSASQMSAESQALIAEICARVDCLPLAIELAAARMNVLALVQIRDRLAQLLDFQPAAQQRAAGRHDTMSTALDWSYELLSNDERSLFMRLSVFAGGFTLEAAEEVCSDESLAEALILPTLSRLIDHSLVAVSERTEQSARYRMLEPVRNYAAQRLRALANAADFTHRHVRWCQGMVKRAVRHWRTDEEATWLNHLHNEHGNIRAALRSCLDSQTQNSLVVALQITVDARRFWEIRGHYREGESWLRQLLDRAEPDADIETYAEALGTLARMLYFQGRYEPARRAFETMVALARQLESAELIVTSVNGLAIAHYELGDYELALRLLNEVEPIARQLPAASAGLLESVLGNYALVQQRVGNQREAQRLFEDQLARLRGSGDLHRISITLHNLALVAECRGDYARARAHAEEALLGWRALGDAHWEANTLGQLANSLAAAGMTTEAQPLAQACLQLYERQGIQADQVFPLATLACIALCEDNPSAAHVWLHRMRGLAHQSGDKAQLARSLCLMALASAQQGDLETARMHCADALSLRVAGKSQAGVAACLETAALICSLTDRPAAGAQFLGTAAAIRDSADRCRAAFEDRAVAQTIKAIRRQISQPAFDAAWRRGATHTYLDAAGLARELMDQLVEKPSPQDQRNVLASIEDESASRADTAAQAATPAILTAREREILSLIAEGLSNPAIARRLTLSVGTVKAHTGHIFGKLGVNNRVQALARARELRLL